MRHRHSLLRSAFVASVVAVVSAAGASVTYASVHPPRTGWSLPTSSTTTTIHHAPPPQGVTVVVSTPTPISGYAKPNGKVIAKVPTTWLGSALVMPVISSVPGWDWVRLPGRPNGSTAWIKTSGLIVSSTPYKIIVNLTTKHLQVLKFNKVVMSAPVGIGTVQNPTPTGNFFIAAFAASPNSSYGPVVTVTTAHSNTITDWAGSGDAVVAIHGPIGADAAIGKTGARVSHGCIRMHVSDQLHFLGFVRLGVPITITY